VSEVYDAKASGRPDANCNGSEIAPRKDAFRCYWPGVDDPCFQSPQISSEFLCMSAYQGNVSVRHLKNMAVGDKYGTHINTGEPGTTSPLRVELVDGTICARSTGSGPVGVPGYPYWAGFCTGPSAGIWRVSEPEMWKNDQRHYSLYPAVAAGGHWQVAISVGAEAAPAKRFDVKNVYR
jgi:hypothetical protein